MTSVNTNYSALVALQSLAQTTRDLESTQNRVTTGLKVGSAKDNGAIFAIAEGQRVRVSSLSTVRDGIDRATSVVDVALAAGEAIGDILKQMKEKAVAAQATDLSSDQRAALQADFAALRTQIDQIADAATFNGANLANGTNLTAGLNAYDVLTSDTAGASITVSGFDFTIGTAGEALATVTGALDVSTAAGGTAASTAIDTALTALNSDLAELGSQAKALSIQKTFLGKLSDSIEAGIGNLVDADLARESARLQSLQVKQQLGAQALAIANAAPSILLSFFR
jgi:flagellin